MNYKLVKFLGRYSFFKSHKHLYLYLKTMRDLLKISNVGLPLEEWTARVETLVSTLLACDAWG
jgi:hypothetical protein